jgi:hypothetical protein
MHLFYSQNVLEDQAGLILESSNSSCSAWKNGNAGRSGHKHLPSSSGLCTYSPALNSTPLTGASLGQKVRHRGKAQPGNFKALRQEMVECLEGAV